MVWGFIERKQSWFEAFSILVIGLFVLASQPSFGQNPAERASLAPLVVLDEYGNHQHLKIEPTINLKARQNYLTITFKAPHLVTIQYKLDGLDNQWLNGLSTDHIHYTNLPGGSYTFRFRELISGHSGYNQINIETPIWNRWWFVPVLFLYLLGVIGLVFYLFLQYRFRQQVRFFQTRDRIARDLHDDMGSYLSSISLLSQSAKRSVTKDPAKAQATLDQIGQTARQVMDSMGDIVWSINPDHDSMGQVIARMTDVASALFTTDDDSTEQIFWQFDVSEEVRQIRLSAENRRDFFLIYKEAITNIAKYAQASRVDIRLNREGSSLILEVNDNGRGFDSRNPVPLNLSGGNGLRNMQNRSALLNGTLTIRSEPGHGTALTLRFPV